VVKLSPITQHVSEGRIVELRTIDLAELMMAGEVPDYLTSLVEFMIAQTIAARGFASLDERDAVEAMLNPKDEDRSKADERWIGLVRMIVRLATVNPIICNDLAEARALRADGKPTAHISQFTKEDLFGIFFRSQGVAADLIPFLLKHLFEEPAVAALSDGAGGTPGAEQPAGGAPTADVGGVPGGLGGSQVGPVRGKQPVGTKRRGGRQVDAGTAAGKP
jgi:hypothetical protein